MKDVLSENIAEKCPKCGGDEFGKIAVRKSNWKRFLGFLLSIFALTHSKYEGYSTACTSCGTEKKW